MVALTECIREQAEAIIQAWSSEASRSASARGLSRADFNNLMRAYLASLATPNDDLERIGHPRRESLEKHLASRLRQGFDLAEIIDEFAVLDRCILDVYAAQCADTRPTARELERLAAGRQAAVAAVKRMFKEYALEDAQGEKRAMRCIQQVATDCMRPGAPSFHAQLGEVADIILEVMQAASITIFLYDPERRDLVACASSGAAKEDTEHYVASLGPDTFAGRVAQDRDQTFSLLDVATTELRVSETLRNSGMHALLGARLPLRCELTGIMYIAVREIRPFEAREQRRFEALAERLALHVETANLYEALRENISALHREKALRERFVAVLAHDLRGPLTAARLASEKLMHHPERLDARRDLAARINNNIDRTDKMVRDLLDANRIQAGQLLPLRLEPCDMNTIAESVVEELTQAHGERFILETDPLAVGRWSADELRRALWNLAVNALKYGAAAKPVTITVKCVSAGVQLSVHNLGPALAEKDLQGLRQMYHRSASASSSGAVGWGLGLTLVQGCAESHGGKLDIVSDATGTTFTLELPLDASTQSPTAHDTASAPAPLH